MGGEGRLPQAEFFFSNPGARQLFQPQGGLSRMRRRRHHQIDLVDLAAPDHQDRQVSRRGGVSQSGDDGLTFQPARFDNSGVDRQVLENRFGGAQRPRRHRGPSHLVQPLAQRADHDVINSDDQYARIGIQKSLLVARSARPRHRCFLATSMILTPSPV
ncbi:hypothetical protein D3C81_1667290 [compost metagenome]